MVRTTNKSCLNSIAVYEPGDPGHSMGEDCVRVGGGSVLEDYFCAGNSPQLLRPCRRITKQGGNGGICNGKGKSWSLAAGAPLGQRPVGASAAGLGQWFCC